MHALRFSSFAFFFAGCVAYTPPQLSRTGQPPTPPPATDGAVICVVGDERPSGVGFAWLSDNGTTVGGVGPETGFCYAVEPGLHGILASWAGRSAQLDVVATKGGRVDLSVAVSDVGASLVEIGRSEGEARRLSSEGASPVDDDGAAFRAPRKPIPSRASTSAPAEVQVCFEHHRSDYVGVALGHVDQPVRPIIDGTAREPLDIAERRCERLSPGSHTFTFDDEAGGVSVDTLTLELVGGPSYVVISRPVSLRPAAGGPNRQYGAQRRGVLQ
ncbi:MAG: hypothetical protein HOW73_45365 [Polyangiaceae bacterium]|nr:hypothetical protein [Polyangiaceae bacterium]